MFAKVYEDTWYNEKDMSSDQSLCSLTLYYSFLFAHISYCNIVRSATHIYQQSTYDSGEVLENM